MDPKPTLQRLMESVSKVNGCWLWQKALSSRGNPSISMKVEGRAKYSPHQATRIMWVEHYGPIPEGKIIRQKCENKLCVSPNHLFLDTKSGLVLDQFKKGRVVWNLGILKEECKYGHSEWSKILPNGGRKCLPCSRIESKRRSASRKRFLDSVKITAGCLDCGFNKHPAALEFDHLDRTIKVANVSAMRVYSWDRLLSEIMKCVVRCSNCHRIKTSEFKEY